jgi:general stress protein 26
MKTDINDLPAVQVRLWNEIENHQIGMLGLVSEIRHFQPMTAFLERASHQLWFFSHSHTPIAAQAKRGRHPALYLFQQRDIQASLAGEVSVVHDEERIDKYWNAVVAAWYPAGRLDPELTMLCFDVQDAEVWISRAGPVRFAIEIAKANATHRRPELSDHATLSFN